MNAYTDLPQAVQSISVVILSGDAAAAAGLKAQLGESMLLDVVGVAVSEVDGARLIFDADVDVCLLWYQSPADLEEVLPLLRHAAPRVALIAALRELSGREVDRLLRSGIRSVIRQPTDLESLPAAIQTFIDNRVFLPLDVQQLLVDHISRRDPDIQFDLTPMQVRVVPLLARGATTDEIAAALGIKARTVKDHLRRLYGRLDVENKAQAVAKLVRSGYGERP